MIETTTIKIKVYSSVSKVDVVSGMPNIFDH